MEEKEMVENARANPKLWLEGEPDIERGVVIVDDNEFRVEDRQLFVDVCTQIAEPVPYKKMVRFRLSGDTAIDISPRENRSRYGKGCHPSFCQICGAVTTWTNTIERPSTFVRTGESSDGFRSDGFIVNNDRLPYCIECTQHEEEEAKTKLAQENEMRLAEAKIWEGKTVNLEGPFVETITILEAKIDPWREPKVVVTVTKVGVSSTFQLEWSSVRSRLPSPKD